MLQGKPLRPVFLKTRSSTAVTKKASKGPRSATVPVERKENVAVAFPSNESLLTQPSCSHAIRHPRPARPNKTLRPKMKRDGYRFKNDKARSVNHIMHNMQNTNCLIRQRLKAAEAAPAKEKIPPKAKCPAVAEGEIQLREICFLKDGEGKKVIAKYSSSEGKSDACDDNLIVSWDPSGAHPTVFSQKQPLQSFASPGKGSNEPGCSRQGAFRVHNFARSGSFNKNVKRSKRSLRRLAASADQAPKSEKLKKRKKAKGKIG